MGARATAARSQVPQAVSSLSCSRLPVFSVVSSQQCTFDVSQYVIFSLQIVWPLKMEVLKV
jgi:hypothetical protein